MGLTQEEEARRQGRTCGLGLKDKTQTRPTFAAMRAASE